MPILSEILNVFHGRVLRSMHMNKKWTTIFDYFDTIPDVYNMVIWLKVIFNSLALGDILGRYMTSSTLFQVMACWLTAPSHYQDQCWFVFIWDIQWDLCFRHHSLKCVWELHIWNNNVPYRGRCELDVLTPNIYLWRFDPTPGSTCQNGTRP